MAYPADCMAPGERVVTHRHPHWKCLLGPLALFVVASAAAGLLSGVVSAAGLNRATSTALGVVIALAWAATLVWLFAVPLIKWKSTHFVLTDRRVMYRGGVLSRSGLDIPIRRINTVEFRHSLLDRILGTGSLTVESAAEEPITFHDVPRVRRVHTLLYREVLDQRDDRAAAFAYEYSARGYPPGGPGAPIGAEYR